jgi:hypothetical protein
MSETSGRFPFVWHRSLAEICERCDRTIRKPGGRPGRCLRCSAVFPPRFAVDDLASPELAFAGADYSR